MSLPRIAIVGRPNVGKSSLFNRLAGSRVSIVDPTPGVTRDRVSRFVEIRPPAELDGAVSRYAEIVDTGGFGVYGAEGARFDDVGADLSTLTNDIEAQIERAAEESDLILFVVDAQAGPTRLDETIAGMLRSSGRSEKVVVVANKVDSDSWEADAMEFAALGLGIPEITSAKSGYKKRIFFEFLWNRIDPASALHIDPEIKLAIVGRRNGLSSAAWRRLCGNQASLLCGNTHHTPHTPHPTPHTPHPLLIAHDDEI